MLILIVAEFCALVLLLALSAFFSSSETALFSLDPLQRRRIEADDAHAAARINRLLASPTRLLSTILIGNTLVNVTASSLGFALAERFAPSKGEAIAVPVMTLLLLIFGEVGPKRIAMFWPAKVSRLYAGILPVAEMIFLPVHLVVDGITRRFEHLFLRRGGTLTEEELESVVDLSHEEGIIAADESAMVKAILGLEDLKASDVMAARVDIVGIDLNDPPEDCVVLAQSTGVRFLPLYTDDLDHIQAMLDVARYLLDPDHVLARASDEPFYLPETATLDMVLAQLQQHGRRVAVVVDEYGGTAGIMTRGDILEEITGEIDDEFDRHKPVLGQLGPGRWLVDANISLEELNERTALDLEAEGVDRLAGWVVAQAERLPVPGEQVEAQGCRAVVREMRRNRIRLVQLERLEPTP